MQLEHHTQESIEFIHLPERLMMADAPAVKTQLQVMLNKQKPKLAFDLSQLEYIDSSGLAVLVSCLQNARRKSGDLCLYGMRDTVRVLFELTRLYDVFPIVDERSEAVRSLSV